MITEPLVSIITVVYNGEKTLERTILSIKNQTYKAIEYIIIDGASTDGTLSLIKNHSSTINYFISEPDHGLYHAMNKALAIAKGEYVWFINSGDEIFDNQTLETAMKTMPSADVYYGKTLIVNNQGAEIGLRRHEPPKNLTYKNFKYGMLVSHQAFIARKTLSEPYNLNLSYSADYEWCLRILKSSTTIVNTHIVLAKFLEGGITHQNILPGLKERFGIMKHHFGLIQSSIIHIFLGIKLLWFYCRNKRF